MCVYLSTTRSSHPHRRLRPVVTPNSAPICCSRSPSSCAPQWPQCHDARQHQHANAQYARIKKMHIVRTEHGHIILLSTTAHTLSCSVGKAPPPTRVV
jgi:hypothetical protein